MKIVMDGMFETYRAHFALKTSNSKGVPTGAVFGFLRSILAHAQHFGEKPCIAWEGPHLTRRDILPEYKANRKSEHSDNVYPQVDKIKQLMSLLGVTQYYADNWEADDVLYSLAEVHGKSTVVFLVTCDSDLFQAVGGNVFVYNPIKKERLGRQEVFARSGVFPEKVALKKAILGDSSDNVPGIKRLSQVVVLNCCHMFESVEDMLSRPEEIPEKIRAKLLENVDLLRRNYSIVKLEDKSPEIREIPKVDDINQLNSLLEELEFSTYIGERHSQLLNFKELKEF